MGLSISGGKLSGRFAEDLSPVVRDKATYWLKDVFILLLLVVTLIVFIDPAEAAELLVKGDHNYPPFEYLNEDGLPDGFNVDVMNAVAREIRLDIKIELGSWVTVRREIEEGKIDVLLGMYKTEERQKKISFSMPHFITSYALFVRKDSKIRDLDDTGGRTIIVQSGDLSHDFLIENMPSDKIIFKDNVEDVLRDLSRGAGDCAIAGRLQGMIMINSRKLDNLRTTGGPLFQAEYCFAVKKGNEALLSKINEGLAIIKNTGEYDEIYRNWFGPYETWRWHYRKALRFLMLPFILVALAAIIFFAWVHFLRRMVSARTKELFESREGLRITLNSIGDAVIATDINGTVKRMNPKAEELTGWTASDAKGKRLSEVFVIVGGKTMERVANPFDKVMEAGETVGLANDTILISRSGVEYQIADSGAPIRDENGIISGVVLVFRDITAEYRVRELLLESEEKFRLMFENAPIGIVLSEPDGRIKSSNSFFRGLTGYTKADLEKRNMIDLAHPGDQKLVRDNYNDIMEGKKRAFDIEKRLVCKNGSVIYLHMTSSIVCDAGNHPVFGITVFKDISLWKKAEAELQKMEKLKSIGTLAGGIAHDFNNILTGIFGNISIVKSRLSKGSAEYRHLEEAEKSMGRATFLTKQLLTFAKGGMPVKENVSLYDIAEEIVRFDLSGSSVKPHLTKQRGLWMAEVDRGQIQQVFSNLTINAREAMPDGGNLYLSFENRRMGENDLPGIRAGKYVRITVKDEGMGINTNYLDRIFDPYFSTKQTGSGLGLATTYSIINRHGGRIEVDSQQGQGTEFTLYIPASSKIKTIKDAYAFQAYAEEPVKAKVLVMDDEKIICEVVTAMLNESGFSVCCATDGKQAAAMYAKALKTDMPFDLVILDLTVPGGLGGKETINLILESDPDAKVIVSSGYADDPVMAKYREYGFSGIVAKPYTYEKLLSVIREALRK